MSDGKKPDDAEKLALLDDVVIEALLAHRADYVPTPEGSAVAAGVRSRIAATKAAVGKRRLELANAAVATDRDRPRLVVSNPEAGAQALRSARAADPKLDRKLTMAARNEDAGFEADKAGIEEDLAELDDRYRSIVLKTLFSRCAKISRFKAAGQIRVRGGRKAAGTSLCRLSASKRG